MKIKNKNPNLKIFPENVKKKAAAPEYLICQECRCVYYDKAWHETLKDFKHLEKEKRRIKFQICPACLLIKNKLYNGLILLKNFDKKYDKELKNLVKNYDKTAREIDPLDRIISAKRKNDDFEILTTENQTAVRLAKKIKTSFANLKLKIEIKYSPSERVTRVVAQ